MPPMPDSSLPQISTTTSSPGGRSSASQPATCRTPATPLALSLAPGPVGLRA